MLGITFYSLIGFPGQPSLSQAARNQHEMKKEEEGDWREKKDMNEKAEGVFV